MSPQFKPGSELNREFYREVVAPIVGNLPHSACLLGQGSDVLGLDTEMSMDHDWGPRLQILLLDGGAADSVRALLLKNLPSTYQQFPVFCGLNSDGTTHMDEAESHRHNIHVSTLSVFFHNLLGIDFEKGPTTADWLAVTQQSLLEATAPNIYHDEIGLIDFQSKLRYFPHDIWLYILASLWQRIGQEEHLVGRAGLVGDELGAKILASRLVRDLMRICFMLERQYIPYPKWFGTLFKRLSCSSQVAPLCEAVLNSSGWSQRDAALAQLFETVAKLQNEQKLCKKLSGEAAHFHGRPFRVIHLHSPFASALIEEVKDPEVQKLAKNLLTGSREILSDNTDFLCSKN